MPLPPSDERLPFSGTPPIRAKKLRYYEDRRFTARLLAPPELTDGVYADRPAARNHDWQGLSAAPVEPAAEEDTEQADGDGSLQQQQRHPGLADEPRKAPSTEPSDPLGLGDDEDELGAAPMVQGMLPLAPAVAADAINQGSDRGSDLIPSFGG
jgi:type IV secretion system protein VirD4